MSNNQDIKKPNFFAPENLPRSFATFAILGASLGFGAGLGVLGPSLPQLSQKLSVNSVEIGQVFTWRGLGTLIGTFLAAAIMKRELFGLTKHMVVTIFALFASFITLLISEIVTLELKNAFYHVKILTMLQGIGFGTMDILATIVIQEIWGQDAGPWLQVRNVLGCIGGLLAPICVSSLGFRTASLVCSFCGLTSLIGPSLERYYSNNEKTNRFSGDFVAPELETLAANLTLIQEEMSSMKSSSSVRRSIDLGNPGDSEGGALVGRDRVLSFATPQIVELLDQPVAQMIDIHLVPKSIGRTLAVFSFVYLGLCYTYGGWIASYTLMIDPEVGYADAALMTSLYSFCVFFSALCVIPASLYFPSTALLRILLTVLFIAAFALFIPMKPVTLNTCSAVLMGLSLSSIGPLMMTVVNDYHMTMDASAVVYIVIGGGIGESIVPAVVGNLVGSLGPPVFPITVSFSALVMIGAYVYVHLVLSHEMELLLYPKEVLLQEDRVPLVGGEEVEEGNSGRVTRTRSKSGSSRGWRSLSVEKYSGSVGLAMITENEEFSSKTAPGILENHFSIENQSPFNSNSRLRHKTNA